MERFDIIQKLIEENNYETYLEIGTQNSINADKIKCKRKVGVDPQPQTRKDGDFNEFYQGKSRDFFKVNQNVYDLIFIDGDHSYEEVKNDLIESIKIGLKIVLHDAMPVEFEATKWPNKTKYGTYNGDVWKLLMQIHKSGKPYELNRDDHGVLVIDSKDFKDFKFNEEVTWEEYVNEFLIVKESKEVEKKKEEKLVKKVATKKTTRNKKK